jgi:ferritin-like protein
MAGTPRGLHEDAATLSRETRELQRGIVSLIEELEAVDWYQQRIDATTDEELRSVLSHNRDEEIEHACMTLEWIRRHSPGFDAQLRRYLFRRGAIVDEKPEAGSSEASLGVGRPAAQAGSS